MRILAKKVLIAANPKSGAGPSRQRVTDLHACLLRRDLQPTIVSDLQQLQAEALQLHQGGQLRAVVSAGGDGTVGALANLLPAEIPLLIFPLGTENLLAKHLGLGNEPGQAAAAIEAAHVMPLDVGQANGKLFLVMLSCGFDADVVHRMHAARSGHIRRWSYARPILSAMAGYRFPQIAARVDDSPAASTAAWLFVFNVPRYAAGLPFCPQADPTDGQLDLCTFQRSGILRGLMYLGRLWAGTHQRMSGFQHQLCRRLHVPAPLDRRGQPLHIPVQIDGDPGGQLPLDIEVLPHRLSLITPASTL